MRLRSRFFALTLAGILLASAARSYAQTLPLLDRLQNAIQTRDERAYLDLVSSEPKTQSYEKEFIQDFLSFDYKNVVFKLVEQQEDKSMVQVFLEAQEESRFESWRIRTAIEEGRTIIKERNIVSQIGGLYRLHLSQNPVEVRNVEFKHLDSIFRLVNGSLFLIRAGDEIAGVIFLGEGIFEFAPRDPTEQQQLMLFCKQPRLQTSLDYLYIRSSASNFKTFFGDLLSTNGKPDPNTYPRAQSIAAEINPMVAAVNIPLSDELWFSRLQRNELYCQMKTAMGTLAYQYSPGDKEDVLLAQKDKDRIISFYNWEGIRTPPPAQEDFKILSYKMRINYSPIGTYLSAVTDVQLLSNTDAITIVFKLNGTLRVTHIRSSQGSLIYFQERRTNNLHVVLNEPLEKGKELALEFYYQGKLSPELARSEAQVLRKELGNEVYIPPTYLYSNQTLWYPQLSSKPYCAVEATISVPSDYTAIGNGRLIKSEPKGDRISFTYNSELPVKYFSLLVGRLNGHFSYEGIVPMDVYYYSIDKSTAERYATTADAILRFYSNYFGRYPYNNLTLVLRPFQEPGGHSPATVAIINRVFTFLQLRFKKDPLYIPEFPTLLLAHELAHQWWGQAVGWRGYQDQWLSEGFAQFAAWEYIRNELGEKAWSQIARIFSDWVEDKSYAGPITLGVRLGHITDDPKAFSAVLYNKGAYVLNMLKNWMGPENFAASLSEFYSLYQFKFAGIAEFREVAQRHSSEDLGPFFQQWLYKWKMPDVTWSQTRESNSSQPILKLRFLQPEENFYRLKIPVELQSKTGDSYHLIVDVDEPVKEVRVRAPFLPQDVEIDPSRENLMKTTETQRH